MDENSKIKASAVTGLSKVETEALLGRKMSQEERQLYDKTKAVLKLQQKSREQQDNDSAEVTTVSDRMPSLKERYSKKEVEEAIVRSNGRWAAICASLNCSYNQLRVWFEHHKDHFELAEQLRMTLVNEAEEQIYKLLHSNDPDTRLDVAKFILKTLGKSKGWSEQSTFVQQINANDKTVEIKSIFGI